MDENKIRKTPSGERRKQGERKEGRNKDTDKRE
jgi:hypothetical protein